MRLLTTALCGLLTGACHALAAPPPSGRPTIPFIDAHVHILAPTPAFYEFLERWNVRMLSVAVVDSTNPSFTDAARQHAAQLEVFRRSGGRVAWCSTFDAAEFETPGFAARTAAALDRTYGQGAVATKIWKNIGMRIKSRAGAYLMPDDPALRPVLDHVAARHKTLFAHLAEPVTCWMPLDKMKPSHAAYYGKHPEWHAYQHPEMPSKEAILAARDRLLAAHPGLRVVGCHLGSMEEDLGEVARHFDRYPNFAVDTAERMQEWMSKPRDQVRAFLIRYQDRILYATDTVWAANTPEAEVLKRLEEMYTLDWRYLATDEMVEFPADRLRVKGLALPPPVLRKIFYENAVRWVPGMAPPFPADRRARPAGARRRTAP